MDEEKKEIIKEKIENARNKFVFASVSVATVFGYILFYIIALAFIFFSVLSLTSEPVEYGKTEGIIVEIRDCGYNFSTESNDYKVFVTYEVEGVTYAHILYNEYNSFMDEGDTVTVLYNLNDPNNITSPGGKYLPYIFLGVGIVVIFVVTGIIIYRVKNKKTVMHELSGLTENKKDSEKVPDNYAYNQKDYGLDYDKNKYPIYDEYGNEIKKRKNRKKQDDYFD